MARNFEELQMHGEMTQLIYVQPLKSMGALQKFPLTGPISELTPSTPIPVPLFLVPFLVREEIALPDVPQWLQEDNFRALIAAEKEAVELLPPPEPYFTEIVRVLLQCGHNLWPHAGANGRQVFLRALSEYMNVRSGKIAALRENLATSTFGFVTALSHNELPQLGHQEICTYLRKLEMPPAQHTTEMRAEALASELNLFSVESYYQKLEAGQAVVRQFLTEDS